MDGDSLSFHPVPVVDGSTGHGSKHALRERSFAGTLHLPSGQDHPGETAPSGSSAARLHVTQKPWDRWAECSQDSRQGLASCASCPKK